MSTSALPRDARGRFVKRDQARRTQMLLSSLFVKRYWYFEPFHHNPYQWRRWMAAVVLPDR